MFVNKHSYNFIYCNMLFSQFYEIIVFCHEKNVHVIIKALCIHKINGQ